VILKSRKALFAITILSFSQLAASAAVDWNWNNVPTDQATLDKAMTTYQNGDVESTIGTLNSLKNGKSQDVRSRHILVDIYKEQKRYPDAKRELSEMIGVFQQYITSHNVSPPWMNPNTLKCEIGDICMEEGNTAEALGYYREALNGQPNLTQARMAIANALVRQGDIDGAKQQFKSAMETPNLSSGEKSYFMSALNQLEQQQNQQAQGGQQGAQGQGRPGQGMPGMQGQGMPGQGMPGQGMQGQGMPGQGMPGQGMPGQGMPGQGMPGQAYSGPGSSSVSMGGTSSGSRPLAVASNDPMQMALGDISSKKYDSAITRLKSILEKSPANAQAHYLLAIAYASSHQSVSAKSEYEATLKYTRDPKLQSMASAGLSKLGGK
jgi:Tfp pilus assembly protein PilF